MFIFLLSSSKDRIPFLMHDHQPGFLLRTTDVKERFPDNVTSNSSEFTWEELQSLNAGEWFLKVRSAPSLTQPHKASAQLHTWSCLTFQTDPFRSVSKLSEEDKAMARNQTIPSLLQLLRLAKQHNISVMFDLYSPNWENDTEDVVDTILASGIDPHLVSLYEFFWYHLTGISHATLLWNEAHFLSPGPLAPSSKTRVCEEGCSRVQTGL